MGESDLLTLAESSTEDSDLLALAKGAMLDPLIGTMVEPKIQLIERILRLFWSCPGLKGPGKQLPRLGLAGKLKAMIPSVSSTGNSGSAKLDFLREGSSRAAS
jgi:hypothetical protein